MQLKPNTLLQGGKYRIVRVLGQGGFGITYEAEQVSLGRKVAIKEFFMKEYCQRDAEDFGMSVPSEGSRALVSRFKEKFLKEARSIASLDDAGIVRVHDVFEENGTAYYVMEYLPGGSLADLCNGVGLPEQDAVRYIRQVASALSYLHSLPTPMNHLDIKPVNILLNRKGEAVLIDFGISKHYDSSGGQTSTTPVGVSHGFSPPEQYKEDGVRDFCPATDIYSLGATLYKLVTGERPPHASDILMDGLPPLPENVSASTRNAIEAAMQPRRKDRPQSIEAFLALLMQAPKTDPAPEVHKEETKKTGDDATVIAGKKNTPERDKQRSSSGIKYNHEWVDLGLPSGLKWATCNIGASSPEEPGDYFAWGETEPKMIYDWKSYKFQNKVNWFGYVDELSKYNASRRLGRQDWKRILDADDDAAASLWGGGWRMPTMEDFEELRFHCDWAWCEFNDRWGCLFTSRVNGQQLFLPAAGQKDGSSLGSYGESGRYWTSSLNLGNSLGAFRIVFHMMTLNVISYERYYGSTIRPVLE